MKRQAILSADIPDLLGLPGLQVERRVVPAVGPLAGDWCDSFELPGGRLGMTVGDASGHGPAAAMHALLLRKLLASALVVGYAPHTAVRLAAERLGDTGERFATAVVAVLDPCTGVVDFANAGHQEFAVLRRARRALDRRGESVAFLAPTGPFIADVFAGEDAWRTRSARLGPGDVLLAFTDGLTEARDGAGNQFGVHRIAAELSRVPNRPPVRLVADVFAAVARHCAGDPADDRTAVAIARTFVPCHRPVLRHATRRPVRQGDRRGASATGTPRSQRQHRAWFANVPKVWNTGRTDSPGSPRRTRRHPPSRRPAPARRRWAT